MSKRNIFLLILVLSFVSCAHRQDLSKDPLAITTGNVPAAGTETVSTTVDESGKQDTDPVPLPENYVVPESLYNTLYWKNWKRVLSAEGVMECSSEDVGAQMEMSSNSTMRITDMVVDEYTWGDNPTLHWLGRGRAEITFSTSKRFGSKSADIGMISLEYKQTPDKVNCVIVMDASKEPGKNFMTNFSFLGFEDMEQPRFSTYQKVVSYWPPVGDDRVERVLISTGTITVSGALMYPFLNTSFADSEGNKWQFTYEQKASAPGYNTKTVVNGTLNFKNMCAGASPAAAPALAAIKKTTVTPSGKELISKPRSIMKTVDNDFFKDTEKNRAKYIRRLESDYGVTVVTGPAVPLFQGDDKDWEMWELRVLRGVLQDMQPFLQNVIKSRLTFQRKNKCRDPEKMIVYQNANGYYYPRDKIIQISDLGCSSCYFNTREYELAATIVHEIIHARQVYPEDRQPDRVWKKLTDDPFNVIYATSIAGWTIVVTADGMKGVHYAQYNTILGAENYMEDMAICASLYYLVPKPPSGYESRYEYLRDTVFSTEKNTFEFSQGKKETVKPEYRYQRRNNAP